MGEIGSRLSQDGSCVGEVVGQIYLKLLFLRVTLWAKLISH